MSRSGITGDPRPRISGCDLHAFRRTTQCGRSHVVILLERISLLLAAVSSDRRDVQHTRTELDESPPVQESAKSSRTSAPSDWWQGRGSTTPVTYDRVPCQPTYLLIGMSTSDRYLSVQLMTFCKFSSPICFEIVCGHKDRQAPIQQWWPSARACTGRGRRVEISQNGTLVVLPGEDATGRTP